VDDRPNHPDDEQEGFRLLGAMEPGDDDAGGGGDPAAMPEGEEGQPIRARDLLGEPESPTQFGAIPKVGSDDAPVAPDPGEPIADNQPLDDEAPAIQATWPAGDEPADAGEPSTELPHWTEPPTGEVPKIFAEGDDDLAVWANVGASQPRWRDQSSGWDEPDFAALGDEPVPIGGRDTSTADDFFTFDDSEAPPDPMSVPRDPTDPYGDRNIDPFAEERTAGPVTGRNMGLAVGVGVGLASGALVLLNLGPAAAMALVVVVVVLASAEMMNALRRVGYAPPALIALAAGITLPLASYWRGESGLVLGLALTGFVALLWYVLGIGSEHAVPNIGVTLLTVVYVAVLGSFAALLLRSPDGTGLLLAAVLGPIFYDIAGLFIGRSMGRSPLSAVSPNKTVEGTIGGMVVAFLVTVVVVGGLIGGGIAPFNTLSDALILGAVLALISPLGDLCESMIKRDLGIKDMGTLLPAHGGVLDRFDAILVALPATYYVALVLL
jgi:phosphatidate cytidylyltransferase